MKTPAEEQEDLKAMMRVIFGDDPGATDYAEACYAAESLVAGVAAALEVIHGVPAIRTAEAIAERIPERMQEVYDKVKGKAN